MSKRFLKYETENSNLPIDSDGVLTSAGGGITIIELNNYKGESYIPDPETGNKLLNMLRDGQPFCIFLEDVYCFPSSACVKLENVTAEGYVGDYYVLKLAVNNDVSPQSFSPIISFILGSTV